MILSPMVPLVKVNRAEAHALGDLPAAFFFDGELSGREIPD